MPGIANVSAAAKACLLTVDVEDYFQVEAFSSVVRREDWDSFELRVEPNTDRVLSLFEEYGVKGTFFLLGWVAEKCPSLVGRIQQQGHEIACHSYWHRPVYRLSREEFREDTRRAKDLLEQIAGGPVLGYRAPSFSVVRSSLWALEVLVEEGFRYDASIYPVHHDTYGIPDWDPRPQWVPTPAGKILEIPGSTFRLFGFNLACGGGGYVRLLPLAANLMALRKIRRTPGLQGVVYFHPWELDPGQPRISAPALSRFRHYTGLRQTERRIRRLLEVFAMKPMADISGESKTAC